MVADLDVLHPGPDLFDGAHRLVAEDAAVGDGRYITLEDVQVGATDRDRVDPDDRVRVVDDHRVWDFFPRLVPGSVVDDSKHGEPPWCRCFDRRDCPAGEQGRRSRSPGPVRVRCADPGPVWRAGHSTGGSLRARGRRACSGPLFSGRVGTVRHALRTFNGRCPAAKHTVATFSGTRPSRACPDKEPRCPLPPASPCLARGTHACRPCTLVSPRSPLRSLDRPLGPGGPGLLEGGARAIARRNLGLSVFAGVPRLLRLGAVERGRAPAAGSGASP